MGRHSVSGADSDGPAEPEDAPAAGTAPGGQPAAGEQPPAGGQPAAGGQPQAGEVRAAGERPPASEPVAGQTRGSRRFLAPPRGARGPLTAVGVAAILVGALLITAGPPPYRDEVHGVGSLAGGPLADEQAPLTTTTPGTPTAPSTPAGPPPGQVSIAFAGDVHFAGRTATRTRAGAQVIGPIAQVLSAADVGMVNLETAITERGTEEPKQYHFRAPATVLDSLRVAGLDVVTMANNHAADYGAVGLQDTLAAIAGHQLPVVGVGANAAQAYAPWYATVRGTRVAIIAASQIHDRTMAAWTAGANSPGIASATSPRLLESVRTARQQAAIVVVYLHWGTEGDACPNAEQRQVAQSLADAGADAVVGTHAHLLLGAGYLGKTYVDYGLGNFLWWLDNAYSNDTGVLTLTFQGRAVIRSSFTPAHIDSRGVPMPAVGAEARRILTKLDGARACTDLAATPSG